jgi:hypothetical protein
MVSMSERHFKLEERRVSKMVGGKRSGYSFQEVGDVSHPQLYVQVKDRKSLALETLFEEVESNARKQKKIPLLSLFDHDRHKRLWIVRPKDINKVAKAIKSSSYAEDSLVKHKEEGACQEV